MHRLHYIYEYDTFNIVLLTYTWSKHKEEAPSSLEKEKQI
jgi:hypothetical protein